jgi:hypothetical protein
VIQDQVDHEIRLEVRPLADSKQGTDDSGKRDWRNAETGEVEYEWPSELDRKRAERRAKLRATFAKKKLDTDLEDEDLDDLEDEEDEAADQAVVSEATEDEDIEDPSDADDFDGDDEDDIDEEDDDDDDDEDEDEDDEEEDDDEK